MRDGVGVTLVTKLQASVAAVENAHQQRNGAEIRAYCVRLTALLERANALLERAETCGGDRRPVALLRWAARIADRLEPGALLACDPRVEQSLEDLMAFAEDELNSG